MSLLYLSKEGVATHQNTYLTDNQSIISSPPSLVSAKTTLNSNPVAAKFATVTNKCCAGSRPHKENGLRLARHYSFWQRSEYPFARLLVNGLTLPLLLKFWLYALLLLLSLGERYIFLFGTQGNDGRQMYCVKYFNLDMILSGG